MSPVLVLSWGCSGLLVGSCGGLLVVSCGACGGSVVGPEVVPVLVLAWACGRLSVGGIPTAELPVSPVDLLAVVICAAC